MFLNLLMYKLCKTPLAGMGYGYARPSLTIPLCSLLRPPDLQLGPRFALLRRLAHTIEPAQLRRASCGHDGHLRTERRAGVVPVRVCGKQHGKREV